MNMVTVHKDGQSTIVPDRASLGTTILGRHGGSPQHNCMNCGGCFFRTQMQIDENNPKSPNNNSE